MIESYPLCWPDGWKRTAPSLRAFGQFGKREPRDYSSTQTWRRLLDVSVSDGTNRVLAELQRMGITRDDIIISTNVPTRLDGLPKSNSPEPGDPGVAVYWRESGNAPMQCMAIDRYTRVADNLAAVAKTLEAMRAIERHGGAEILERAFRGFAALPEKASEPWRQVLGISIEESVNAELVERKFRELCRVHHPDAGGDADKFQQLLSAREQARKEVAA
jgi:hypothetical protein